MSATASHAGRPLRLGRTLGRGIVPETARTKLIAQYNQAACQQDAAAIRKGDVMDAKYNGLIDNIAMRLALNTAAFALWLAMAVALLELAVKV